MADIQRQIGTFHVPERVIKEVENGPALLAEMLADLEFVPVEVKYDWSRNALTYVGLSPKFDEIPTYSVPVEYYFNDAIETQDVEVEPGIWENRIIHHYLYLQRNNHCGSVIW